MQEEQQPNHRHAGVTRHGDAAALGGNAEASATIPRMLAMYKSKFSRDNSAFIGVRLRGLPWTIGSRHSRSL